MSDTFGTAQTPASPTPAEPTSVVDPIPTVRADDDRPTAERTRRNPLDEITAEQPRNHPVAYAALLTAVLAFVLAALALSGDDDGGYRQVRIGENDCVIGRQADTDVLYCRTATVP